MSNYKIYLTIISAFCCLLPITSSAEDLDLTITSDTIRRSYQRNTPQGKDVHIMPVYQFLQGEYHSASIPELHAHAYGWYRADMGDLKFYDKNHTGDLLYGYLEYAPEKKNFNAKLGRQSVFSGPSYESFDGLMVTGDLISSVNLSAYYGLPVGIDEERQRGDDKIVGGRLSLMPEKIDIKYCLFYNVNLGLSYLQIDKDGVEDKKLAGIDYYIDLPGILPAFTGESNFNLITDGWAEHFIETTFTVSDFDIRPYLQQAQMENYISSETSSIIKAPFNNLKSEADDTLETGVDVNWHGEEEDQYGGRFKYFDYNDNGESENSFYFSGLATFVFLEDSDGWVEAGRMQGSKDKYKYISGDLGVEWELPFEFYPITATGEVSYLYYDQEIYDTSDSVYLAIGLGTTFFDDELTVNFKTSYASDPYYKKDFQSLLTLSYQFISLDEEDMD